MLNKIYANNRIYANTGFIARKHQSKIIARTRYVA